MDGRELFDSKRGGILSFSRSSMCVRERESMHAYKLRLCNHNTSV